MKPKRIILVRHGESTRNANLADLATEPSYASQLTELGRKQAFEAGLKIKEIIGDETVQFYGSPFWRARQTYQEINKTIKGTYYEDPRLREQDFGHFRDSQNESKLDDECDAYGHFYYRFPNGESGADVYDRVSDALNTVHRDFTKPNFPQNAIFVNHGLTIRLILMRWFHYSVEEFEILANIKNGELVPLDLEPITDKYDLVTILRKYEKPTHPYQFKW